MPKVRITSEGGALGDTHLFIDDVEIKGVQSLELCADVDNMPPYLKLCMITTEIEVEGDIKDIYTFAEGKGHKITSL